MASSRSANSPATWSIALVCASAVLVAIGVAVLARTRVETGLLTTTDLEVFRVSGLAIRTGHDPYQFWLVGAHLTLVYPPFAGLVFSLASLLPLAALRIVWFSAVLVALQGLVWLVTGWVGLRAVRPRVLMTVLAPLAVFVFDPLFQELWSGQVNVFLALLVLADLCRPAGARGRGIAIGIAAGLKVTPGLFILYLLLTKQFRAARNAVITFLATVAAGFAVIPGPAWHYWSDYLWHSDRITSQPYIVFDQNLDGLLLRLSAPQPLIIVVEIAVGLLGMATCVALHRRGRPREAVALCGIVVLLVSPISWVYHWVWLMPVLAVLAAAAVRTRSVAWITATVLTAAIAVLHPYTWPGGFSAVPSGLFGGYRGWWPSWTGFTAMPHGVLAQLAGNSLVLLGLLLVAGGVVVAFGPRETSVA